MISTASSFQSYHRPLRHSFRIYSEFDKLMKAVLNTDLSTKDLPKISAPEHNSENGQTQNGWKEIRWESLRSCDFREEVLPGPSSVERVLVKNKLVHVKRDDQLRLPGSQISGNKARKMFALDQLKDFPKCVVSYGGPQSNAMVALAAAVHFQNTRFVDTEAQAYESQEQKRFIYYTKKLPKFLRNQPSGNIFRAKLLGMELIELPHEEYNLLFGGDYGGSPTPPAILQPPIPGDSVWIPQGGACAVAMEGSRRLAQEICDYWVDEGERRPLSIFIPGGTCSTALCLHRALKDLIHNTTTSSEIMDVEVVVVPCVADESYARRQMMSLNCQLEADPDDVPRILESDPNTASLGKAPNSYLQFGQPHQEILDAFQWMQEECDLSLDLLYGSSAWAILLRHWKTLGDVYSFDREIMYVHSGGTEGINSQLLRYRYVGLLSSDEIQLPGKRQA